MLTFDEPADAAARGGRQLGDARGQLLLGGLHVHGDPVQALRGE